MISRSPGHGQRDPFAVCCRLAPLPPVERAHCPITLDSFPHHRKIDAKINIVHEIFIYDTSVILRTYELI